MIYGPRILNLKFWHIINDLRPSLSKLEVMSHERSCNTIHQINLIDFNSSFPNCMRRKRI